MSLNCKECGHDPAAISGLVAAALLCIGTLVGGYFWGQGKLADKVCQSRGAITSTEIDSTWYCEYQSKTTEKESILRVPLLEKK